MPLDLYPLGGGQRLSFSHRQLNIAVNSISLIATHRPHTVPRICPVLGEVLRKLRDFTTLSPHQRKSVSLSTKGYLLKLLRLPGTVEHSEIVMMILKEQGLLDQAEKAKSHAL